VRLGDSSSVIEGFLTCDKETQGITHMSKVGGRKESIGLINDNLKQTKGGEKL
jgi:hypothetical protein